MALGREAEHQKKLVAVEAEMEKIQAEIDAEEAVEEAARESCLREEQGRMEEYMAHLAVEIAELRVYRF